MKDDDFNQRVEAYIRLGYCAGESDEYKANLWVRQWAQGAVRGNPETLWQFILAVIASDDSASVLSQLSDGPLQDLLVKHGKTFIARIELQVKLNPAFRNLLGGVWKSEMTDEIWHRVQAARLHKAS